MLELRDDPEGHRDDAGVPCQVDGVRLQQNSSIRLAMADWYRDNISLVVGLLCSESFTHESIAKLGEMIDVAPERIDNINIKGKVVVRLDDGEVVTSLFARIRADHEAMLEPVALSGSPTPSAPPGRGSSRTVVKG